ncbi:leucine-rich repeat-containing G-protein coupled receptor 5-like isoform X2 [Dreissena polymorpha]|uniref:leucine-rich repeat-containing G-protein coupled receptor 5-like isoform X2 n=1 Tax=Dreissena polymorpha TaxID=45954 RepID=UPI0022640000|nr:leucine-rich repeat-containing G-protein coupled receptor 5-like isoform X2 [Dreissena polymorpha]
MRFLVPTLALVHLTVVTGFLLDHTCLIGTTCTCTSTEILCNNQGLDNVPSFKINGRNTSIDLLDMSANNITVLTTNAFTSLGAYVTSSLRIDVSDNKIRVIEDGCFNGLEDMIVTLDLSHNNLQGIPTAVASLSKIRVLKVEFNPIIALDSFVLSRIGNTLENISITLDRFKRWPNELHFLFKLKELTVYNFNSPIIRNSDFHYITQILSLSSIELSHSPLEEFPGTICDMSNLNSLNIANNAFVDRTVEFFSICHAPLNPIRTLSMHSNNFDVLPDIGKIFPNIEHLNFSDNNLRYLNNELTAMSRLISLDLNNNRLAHFPSTLDTLTPSLQVLYLRNNSLIEIDNKAFTSLTSLQMFFLDMNPLEYIGANTRNVNRKRYNLTW